MSYGHRCCDCYNNNAAAFSYDPYIVIVLLHDISFKYFIQLEQLIVFTKCYILFIHDLLFYS